MIKEGSVINIKPSEDLYLSRLSKLTGREAVILEILTSISRINKGYMVKLTEPYLGEDIWFIPQASVEDE